jgi:hypothetical protein
LGRCASGWSERNRLPGRKQLQLRGRALEHYLFGMQVVAGRSLAWKNISDMRRAVSLLAVFRLCSPGDWGVTVIPWGRLIRGWSVRGNRV